MKRLLKLLGGLLGAVVLAVLGLFAYLALSAVWPAHPVGVQQVLAADPGHPPIGVTIYYPTTEAPGLHWLGMSFAYFAPNAAITDGRHPLVVISHGTAGGPMSHLDTALALAEAGYVVAAPLHNGDNFQDTSKVGTSEWFIDRSRQIARVNDFLLDQWKDRDRLDPKRLGIFGFSAGGTTALIAVGGTPDFGLVEPLCKSHPEFVCQLQKPGVPMRVPAATEWTHDARISAAVVVAPGYGFTFEPDGLSAVRARVQLWEGSLDASLPLATNAGAVRRLLPQPPEFHLVDNADHFSFLMPCGAAGLLLPKMLCADPDGFDRTAFHAQFNAAVVAFFNESLREPAGEQNVSGSDEPPAH
ncbi:MAG: dienelactone hydrolase [Rhodanobacteraceae bacterium]|jgi:predicted dienelactone hydrolase|nr:dienelactone hydrolase [Rhodanobacteraceae bacterium]